MSTEDSWSVRSAPRLVNLIHKTRFWRMWWTILTLNAMTSARKFILSLIMWDTSKEISVMLVIRDNRRSNQNRNRSRWLNQWCSNKLRQFSRRQLFLSLNLCFRVKIIRIRDLRSECAICCKKIPKTSTLLISKIHPVESSKVEFKINSHIISKLSTAQMDNFTWSAEETTKEMTNHFTTFSRSKLQTHITLSNVIPWNIQDTDIQPFGLVKSSSLLPDLEKRKIVPKSSVKCTTLISIFGLKCRISILVDIITRLAPSTTSSSMFFAELPMLLESISTPSRNMTTIKKRDGRLLKSVPNFSVIGKVAELFKEITKISLSLVDSQADS